MRPGHQLVSAAILDGVLRITPYTVAVASMVPLISLCLNDSLYNHRSGWRADVRRGERGEGREERGERKRTEGKPQGESEIIEHKHAQRASTSLVFCMLLAFRTIGIATGG